MLALPGKHFESLVQHHVFTLEYIGGFFHCYIGDYPHADEFCTVGQPFVACAYPGLMTFTSPYFMTGKPFISRISVPGRMPAFIILSVITSVTNTRLPNRLVKKGNGQSRTLHHTSVCPSRRKTQRRLRLSRKASSVGVSTICGSRAI